MNGPQITVVGHVGGTPRSRALAGGTIVSDFRLATTPRRQDKASGQWTDLETLWFGVTCWRNVAENAAQSLQTGDRVIVTGRLLTRSWTDPNGEKRSGLEIDASSVGMDLSRGPVTQQRTQRGPAPTEDPWATADADPLTGEVPAQRPEPAAA